MKAVFMLSSTLVLLCWLSLLLCSTAVVVVGGPSPRIAFEAVVVMVFVAVTFAAISLVTSKWRIPKTASVQGLIKLDVITLLLGLPLLLGFYLNVNRRLN
jgi:hypothetical protein